MSGKWIALGIVVILIVAAGIFLIGFGSYTRETRAPDWGEHGDLPGSGPMLKQYLPKLCYISTLKAMVLLAG